MFKKIKILIQYLLPHHLLSKCMGYLANCEQAWLKNIFIRWFVTSYRVDLSIAQKEKIEDYRSFNDFFIRPLKEGARPICDNKDRIISPVDGFISEFGEIQKQNIFQAKGYYYQLNQLLGNSQFSNHFVDGNFINLYLSPSDYHRVHIPFGGKLEEMIYVPGKLFSVNPLYVKSIPQLFTQNERVVSIFKTEIGYMAVVMVGAMIVGSVNTVWSGKVTPNEGHQIQRWDYQTKNTILSRGEEMGSFSFGSTVIVLFEKNKMILDEKLIQTMKIQMGQEIGWTIK